MIKDFLISFKDNFKEKTRNPFLGTYLVVWIIRNWLLVYTLFNFDPNHNLKFKLNFIEEYYIKNDFLLNLATNILWAFAILIITYLVLNISRFIINISEKQITPLVYKISDSKSIVLKETFDNLNSEKINLEIKLEKERENKSRLQAEILRLETKLEENYLNKSNKGLNIESNKENLIESNSPIDLLFNKVNNHNFSSDFLDTELFLSRNEGWIEDSERGNHIDYLTKLGLLRIIEARNGLSRYTLTENGKKVLDKIRLILD
ncbi:hypothetical protein VBZ51_01645 [Maribacter sp. HS]|uniref:hypothetical protein n=1 Tax=Maribacter sp. HS TaxID=3110480 RepID=UPI003A8461AB